MDKPDYSEVLGVFGKKDDAVAELLERANYRETKGELTQYMLPCTEYNSFSELYELVSNKMELTDVDIYRITKIPLE